MKKFKQIIAAAAVFAVVGGALAFKTFNPANIYCDTTSGTKVCTRLVSFTSIDTGSSSTTNPCGESTATKHYSTTQDNLHACPAATFPVYTPND